MKAFCSAAFLALLALEAALAAPVRNSLRVYEDTLANGLRVLVCEKHDTPVVSVQIWYRVGSRNERPGRTGISHLLEHMMFKVGRGPVQFNDAVQRLGGRANAFTGEDYTCYHEEVAREHWETVLAMEAMRMSGLEIDSSELETERQVVLEERRLGENSPSRALLEELEAAAFKHHSYGWPIIGYTQDIRAITRDDLREHYSAYYRPDNAVCVVVGDVARNAVLKAVGRHFGPIMRPGPKPPSIIAVEPPQNGERRVQLRRPSRTAFLSLSYHTVRIGHPDSYALDVLSTILSEGESSRLYRRLVRERGLAAYAGGYNKRRMDPTLFTFYAAPAVGRSAAELEAAILGEVEDVQLRGVSDWELQKAKNQIESRMIGSRQRAYQLGTQIGSAQTQLSWRYLDGYLENIRAVTNGDIIRVAGAYLDGENRTVAMLVPSDPGVGDGQ